jgi:hypothetical protein
MLPLCYTSVKHTDIQGSTPLNLAHSNALVTFFVTYIIYIHYNIMILYIYIIYFESSLLLAVFANETHTDASSNMIGRNKYEKHPVHQDSSSSAIRPQL